MKISIITVNYNDRKGLEKTIRSVQRQTATNFEHIIIDGNSTDGSTKVICKNKKSFSYWISEEDTGIYDAMNKGTKKASGDYLLFLNSGDELFQDHTLSSVSPFLETGEDIVYGDLWIQPLKGGAFRYSYPARIDFYFLKRSSLGHPATFIRKELLESHGYYRTDLKIVSDWEFFLNAIILQKASQKYINKIVATFYGGGVSNATENIELHKREREKVLIENFKSLDCYFNSLISMHLNDTTILSKIHPSIYHLVTNKKLMQIINAKVRFLGFLLRKKRHFFNKD